MQRAGRVGKPSRLRSFGWVLFREAHPQDALMQRQIGLGAPLAEQRIGRVTGASLQRRPVPVVEAGQRGCTVRGQAGTWTSTKDWSATHNA